MGGARRPVRFAGVKRAAVVLALCFACRARIQAVGSSASAPSELSFGDVQVGEKKGLKLAVSNSSLSGIELTSVESPPPFTVEGGPVTVPSGGTVELSVVFAPDAAQAFDQSLTLELSATDTPSLSVHLTGRGVAAAACSDATCGSGSACCGGACVDTQSSADHCGGCSPCDSGQTCVSGACTTAAATGCSASTCGAGHSCCGDSCVDTQTDPNHCGSCLPCVAGANCIGGTCVIPAPVTCDTVTNPCPGAEKCCDHECLDVGPGGLCPCTSPGGGTTFDSGTIIIPMDACYQRGEDIATLPAGCNAANASPTGSDAPLKAYGLVFFLLRHQVTVYMGINPNKTAPDDVDLSIGSFITHTTPVQRYDWASGNVVALPDTTANSISYRGAPFIIDASEHDRVLALLRSDPDFAQFRSAGNVTVHVTGKSFSTSIAKSINAVPSKIALLVPNNDTTPVDILVNYLDSAGLNFPGAEGTLYDKLQQSDFLPDYEHSNLKAGGYRLLWSPHWAGDGSADTAAQLATIGSFVAAGNDLFAECAAIGTLEGFSGGRYTQAGSPTTRFLTSAGMTGNALAIGGRYNPPTYTGPFAYDGLTSPFAQRGDFPFAAFVGLVTDSAPALGSSYAPGVTRYITATSTGTDVFASIDLHASGKGTVVYLAGHDYSYGGNTPSDVGITAGSRLVLNTLFSLGENNICQP